LSTPARATDVVFTRHPAARGVAWLRTSWALFRAASLPWLVLISLYYLVIIVTTLALSGVHEVLGQAAAMVLKPVFAVGMLAAAWSQERGQAPHPRDLFRGFRANLRALLLCGAALYAGVWAAMQIASALSNGTLEQLLAGPQPPPEELLRDSRLQLGLLAGVLAALPVMLALWFAPALVVFQDARATTALGASLRAALANWRPILVYALGVFVFGMMLPAVVGQLVVALVPSEITIAAVRFALFAWLLMFGVTLHISDYVSYRDIFHAGETLSPLTAGRPPGER
jgi:hypothetical protein